MNRLLVFLFFLLIVPIGYSEITEPLHIAYCKHMGYTVEINSENIPTCNFGDNTICTTTQFFKKECAQDKVKEILPRKEGETVYVELGEKCEDGLVLSEPQYLLDQPVCIKPSIKSQTSSTFNLSNIIKSIIGFLTGR